MIIALIIAAILVALIIFIYNSLVRHKVRVDEAWSDITVQLKRRADLIPNVIETVKGYAKHEREVLQKVTDTRAATLDASTPKKAGKAENMFQDTLKSLFAVAEAYPDLKANENFKQLQEELSDTEDKVQAARRFYNGAARDLNTRIQVFPNLLFARLLGFKEYDFFEVEEGEAEKIAEPTKVDFTSK